MYGVVQHMPSRVLLSSKCQAYGSVGREKTLFAFFFLMLTRRVTFDGSQLGVFSIKHNHTKSWFTVIIIIDLTSIQLILSQLFMLRCVGNCKFLNTCTCIQ
jgi:hypothetical protein